MNLADLIRAIPSAIPFTNAGREPQGPGQRRSYRMLPEWMRRQKGASGNNGKRGNRKRNRGYE